MKHLLGIVLFVLSINAYAEKVPAYFKTKPQSSDLTTTLNKVKSDIKNAGYSILGEYSPAENQNDKVIVFSNSELQSFSNNFNDRGALGAILRIGIKAKNSKTTVSIANPYYMFNAYWGKDASDSQKATMKKLSNKALSILGTDLQKFGGEMDEDDLAEYHYKMMMPYFTDPAELNDYNSFTEGTSIIEKNLKSGKNNTSLVYKLKIPGKNIIVYGIELKGKTGESNFLSKIGDDHISALPYEIILQNKEVTMLAGKYRLALYWPKLSMSQFMDIMNTPGDIEETLESICK